MLDCTARHPRGMQRVLKPVSHVIPVSEPRCSSRPGQHGASRGCPLSRTADRTAPASRAATEITIHGIPSRRRRRRRRGPNARSPSVRSRRHGNRHCPTAAASEPVILGAGGMARSGGEAIERGKRERGGGRGRGRGGEEKGGKGRRGREAEEKEGRRRSKEQRGQRRASTAPAPPHGAPTRPRHRRRPHPGQPGAAAAAATAAPRRAAAAPAPPPARRRQPPPELDALDT